MLFKSSRIIYEAPGLNRVFFENSGLVIAKEQSFSFRTKTAGNCVFLGNKTFCKSTELFEARLLSNSSHFKRSCFSTLRQSFI
jgi:hypothetical protein